MPNALRTLLDNTLEEAVEVMKLGENYDSRRNYQLRKRRNCQDIDFAQLFYLEGKEEKIAANFSDTKNAVHLCQGNTYYRTMYSIIKYLGRRGFDLDSAELNG